MPPNFPYYSKKGFSDDTPPPISLGKPSLRARLEAYYTLVSHEQIADSIEWRTKFDQIWEKFGGTHHGELQLASKLTKKYGTAVQLITVASAKQDNQEQGNEQQSLEGSSEWQQSEEWYALNEKEEGSGCIDLLSDKLDPVAALHPANLPTILATHPFIAESPILDRVEQFRSYLPSSDPLYRPPILQSKPRERLVSNEIRKIGGKKLSCFAVIAESHQVGPFAVLFKAFTKRYRIRVITRYVDSIRGTLTGYLVAFDKHMNMILRDVDEHYTPPRRKNFIPGNVVLSNLEVEMQRRIQATGGQPTSNNTWTLRQRHMRQIMLRGDIVVAVYKAADERSAWPVTLKSPKQSQYRTTTCIPPMDQRVGTPGSLLYAAHVKTHRHPSGSGGTALEE